MKTATFKTGFEIAEEIINSNIKNIHDALTLGFLAEHGDTIMMFVSENSDKFTKNICKKALLNNWELSQKQAWCVAYEVIAIRSMYHAWYLQAQKEINKEF